MTTPKYRAFDKDRKGTGTREWSEHSYNIQKGCPNNCIYCYARYNAVHRYKYIKDIEQWKNPVINEQKVSKKWNKVEGVIMFPTVHDIDKGNISQCVTVLHNMLEAGNDVLIVSKPDEKCIKVLIHYLRDYKEQILFRFTIGSVSNTVLKLFEPSAPDFASRHLSLKIAYDSGFKTSISAEPLLGGIDTLSRIYEFCAPYVTDSIWVGKMNKINQRVLGSISSELKDAINTIIQSHSDEEVLKMYEFYKHDTKIEWKDSIKKIINQ